MNSFAQPKALVGVLKENNFLENPVKILEGKIVGPEHLLNRDGAIFTSSANGDVVKIVNEKITVLGKFGKLCCELRDKSIDYVLILIQKKSR